MPNVNKVILIGNVTRDPEIKYTPKGSAVTDVGLAINRNYTLDNGEKREETTFVEVTLWGRQAEVAAEYAKKGRPLYVEGRLQLDTWDDKTSGQKRTKLRIVGENIQLLGGRPGGSSPSGGSEFSEQEPRSQERPAPQRPSRPAPSQPSEPSEGSDADDVPF